ncbi:hypothetical protein B5K06_24850 [Rhizobium grahamii]|uniref:Uncharacterized protein n=1 Tax=Rhizobium grahamii TaxID=1120045 RepID=A0A370KIG2_9HYPH|nr:hypothetical protein B5K06_24850 [Rhizobium grahamii]
MQDDHISRRATSRNADNFPEVLDEDDRTVDQPSELAGPHFVDFVRCANEFRNDVRRTVQNLSSPPKPLNTTLKQRQRREQLGN